MTEAELNDNLKTCRDLADMFYEHGNKDLGAQVLRLGSEYAEIMLKLHKLGGKVVCRQCKKESYIAEERDYIRSYGVCLGCDHMYGEILDELQAERNIN